MIPHPTPFQKTAFLLRARTNGAGKSPSLYWTASFNGALAKILHPYVSRRVRQIAAGLFDWAARYALSSALFVALFARLDKIKVRNEIFRPGAPRKGKEPQAYAQELQISCTIIAYRPAKGAPPKVKGPKKQPCSKDFSAV